MRDKNYLSQLALLALVSIFSIAAFSFFQNVSEKEEKNPRKSDIREIRIGENIFRAEIADTYFKRSQGLSGRKDLCQNCAMLFLFAERKRLSFWMKEMKFDLDIIWIDNDEIVHIAKNVSQEKEFETIKPEKEADKVLEINAGLADRLDIEVGDKIEF